MKVHRGETDRLSPFPRCLQNNDETKGQDRLSVIDCLSAGFRFVRWRLELLVIPVLLDVFLWLAPPLRVTPLVVQLAEWYRSLASVSGMPEATVALTQQIADSLEQSSDAFNLLSALTSTWLLHMPSLLAGTVQLSPSAIEVGTAAEALLFWILFTLLGLLLGVIYLSLLARCLPIGSLSGLPVRLLPARILLHWLRILGLLLLILLLLLAIYLPLSLAIGLLTLLNPAIGSFLALASGALSLLVFFYLYFATAAVVMDTLSPVAALRRLARRGAHHPEQPDRAGDRPAARTAAQQRRMDPFPSPRRQRVCRQRPRYGAAHLLPHPLSGQRR